MRSIFWRIFLTFWLAIVLIVPASVLVSFYLANQRNEAMSQMRPHEVFAQAADQVRAGGRDGLTAWLRANDEPAPGMRLLVFDADGRELLGRKAPRDARPVLSRAWNHRHPGIGRLPDNFRPPHRWPRVVAPDGSEYAMMLFPSKPHPLGVFGFGTTRIAVLSIALLVSAAVCWVLARTLSAPVLRIQQATRALAGGALGTRVAPGLANRRDELGDLARDFDAMAARLERLLRSQRELLRNVSHELRSPLARMTVALELARRRAPDAGDELERIEREAGRLDALIGQVLALARLEDGAAGQAPEPVDLVELVTEVVADARFEAGEESVQFEPGDAIGVRGDRALLRSAVENVVRNAVRYTADGTVVTVALRRQDDDAVLAVTDHGPGVPDEALESIFEPFVRVAEARERDSGGEGIGLAITAGVVRAHGGRVAAKNAPGGGLTVELALPSGG